MMASLYPIEELNQVAKETLYVDSGFPPNDSSLGKLIDKIEWRRPKEIVVNPGFIVDGACRHDISQGGLGDCWFLASAASLAASLPNWFNRVVPPHQTFTGPEYKGMFRFNIWWYNVWTEVIIDDYLPTINEKLVCCQIDEKDNEFWPCLLEKAYAKLHGSYHGLKGGYAQDALVDLTGGISETIHFDDDTKSTSKLYNLLKQSFKMNTLMTASTPGSVSENTGLLPRHAYTITAFKRVRPGRLGLPPSIGLVRLRNPWGRVEWKGAWSDTSVEMRRLSQAQKTILLKFKKQDEGEFWMSFSDFRKTFERVALCHLQVENVLEELEDNQGKPLQQSWKLSVSEGLWKTVEEPDQCAGCYWRNPRICLNLGPRERSNHSTMIVSLLVQKRDRNSNLTVGLEVIKERHLQVGRQQTTAIDDQCLKKSKEPIYIGPKYSPYREITKRYRLTPGIYAIMLGTNKPDEIYRFILRMYTDSRSDFI